MPDTVDTRMISFDEPLNEGFAKIFILGQRRYRPRYHAFGHDVEIIVHETGEEDEACAVDEQLGQTLYVRDLFHLAPPAMPKMDDFRAAMDLLVAYTKMSAEDMKTAAFRPSDIMTERPAQRPRIVTVSPELARPREEIYASSLLAPSGFHLTWLEMCHEEPDDQEE